MSERETVVELPFAADWCPCVEKLRTVLPFTVGIRDGAVQLVSTLGSVVISARAELGSIIASALPVATMLTCQCVCVCVGVRVCACGFCSVRRLVSTRCVLVSALRLSPVSSALLLQGYPRNNAQCSTCGWVWEQENAEAQIPQALRSAEAQGLFALDVEHARYRYRW